MASSSSLQAQQLGSNIFGDRMGRMQGAAQGMGALTGQQFRQAMDAYGQSGAAATSRSEQGIAGLGPAGLQHADLAHKSGHAWCNLGSQPEEAYSKQDLMLNTELLLKWLMSHS